MKKIFGYLLSFLLGIVGCLGFGGYRMYKKHKGLLNRSRPSKDYTQHTWDRYKYPYKRYRIVSPTDDYMDISFDTRMAAERTLTILKAAYLEKYGIATVADLKEISGLCASYSDNDYGWTNLAFARVYRARDGKFYLDLPEAMPIDKD